MYLCLPTGIYLFFFFFCVNLQAMLLLPLGNRSAQLEEPGIIYIYIYIYIYILRIVKFVPRGDLLCFKYLSLVLFIQCTLHSFIPINTVKINDLGYMKKRYQRCPSYSAPTMDA